MSRYYFNLLGIDDDDVGVECDGPTQARNAAVVYLGEYLRDYPGYASEGHWQVDVLDSDHNPIFNVVIATVDVRAARKTAAR